MHLRAPQLLKTNPIVGLSSIEINDLLLLIDHIGVVEFGKLHVQLHYFFLCSFGFLYGLLLKDLQFALLLFRRLRYLLLLQFEVYCFLDLIKIYAHPML